MVSSRLANIDRVYEVYLSTESPILIGSMRITGILYPILIGSMRSRFKEVTQY